MSNSTRKPFISGGKSKRFFKRQASKRVRRLDVGSGSNYRKCFQQYKIQDQTGLIDLADQDKPWQYTSK